MIRSTTKHHTPGITLEQFIALKPHNLRLGQWFVNCYLKPIKTGNNYHWEALADELHNSDGAKAKRLITQAMNQWQWSTLPEII